MIHVYLSGGIGNQMFEYACAVALAQKYNDNICVNTIQVESDKLRKYSLDCFVLDKDLERKSKRIMFHNPDSPLFRLIRHLSKEISWTIGLPLGNYFWKDARKRNFPERKTKKNIYLDGYWQSESYFHGLEGKLRKSFLLNPKKIISKDYETTAKMICDHQSVCVHIRLGDYEKNSVHAVCTPEYYMKGIDYITGKIKRPVFFVFSDNIEKAKQMLKNKSEEFHFISSSFTDYESMSLMTMCKYFVISNSSFSWWAQFLSESEDKIVIAPDKWYNDSTIPYELKSSNWTILE